MDRKKPEVTTAIILEKRVANKDKKHPVKLRITYQGKRKYYTIKGEHYKQSEFSKFYNEDARGKNKIKRKKFDEVDNRAIDIIDNTLNEFSFEAFEKEYSSDKKTKNTIQEYFEAKALELDNANKFHTATLYKSTIKSLLDFDEKITFQKITPKYLKKYEDWMLDNNKSYTTIGMYLRNLKHIINLAKDKVIIDYPFGEGKNKYQIKAGSNTKKALSLNDIGKLYNHKPDNRDKYLALQYWLFSYFCNGMNMVDIANLKYEKIKEKNIEFIRQKTKDTSKKVPTIKVLLLPEVQEIINNIGNGNKSPENYIFPIFKAEFDEKEKYNRLKQHIKNTNKYIKEIAKDIGINENITTYWARHTYSTVLKRSGVPVEFISEQLGHQSIEVTKSYLDSFEDEHREKYSKSLLPKKN